MIMWTVSRLDSLAVAEQWMNDFASELCLVGGGGGRDVIIIMMRMSSFELYLLLIDVPFYISSIRPAEATRLEPSELSQPDLSPHC